MIGMKKEFMGVIRREVDKHYSQFCIEPHSIIHYSHTLKTDLKFEHFMKAVFFCSLFYQAFSVSRQYNVDDRATSE
jgi:hypothetical protein